MRGGGDRIAASFGPGYSLTYACGASRSTRRKIELERTVDQLEHLTPYICHLWSAKKFRTVLEPMQACEVTDFLKEEKGQLI